MEPLPGPSQVTIVTASNAPSFIVRALWYIFIGWWLGGIVISLGYLLLPWIITTPISFWLFNRIGSAMTLRPRSQQFHQAGNVYAMRSPHQRPWFFRLIWFVLVGWWLGAIWLTIAYAFCLLLITWPLGMMMIDRTAGVITLQRN